MIINLEVIFVVEPNTTLKSRFWMSSWWVELKLLTFMSQVWSVDVPTCLIWSLADMKI